MNPKALLLELLLLSLFSLARCCPYLLQPSSFNVSQGTPAQFIVEACSNVIWAVNNFVYPAGYNFSEVTVVQETLNSNAVRSTLTLPTTNSTKYDNAMIAATVYAPQAIRSDNALLRIQGLLDVVSDLKYSPVSQQLSWTPPFTLFGVPISHYRITVSESNMLQVFTTNSTLPTLSINSSNPCQQYNAIILAVNAVGEGTAASLNYTYVGVPLVDYTKSTGTINNDTFSAEVLYQIGYNCTDQIPVIVYATTRNTYTSTTATHSNQSVIGNGMNGSSLNGSYIIDELMDDTRYIGQLVFQTRDRLSVQTQEFELWTFDLHSVTISLLDSQLLCVNVTYTKGSNAKGFVIKTVTREWNILRNDSITCVPLTEGSHLVQVFDWNSDGSVSKRWRKEKNVIVTASSSPTPPNTIQTTISPASTLLLSIVTTQRIATTLLPTMSTTVVATDDTKRTSSHNTAIVAGVTVAVLLPIVLALVVLFVVLAIIWKRRRASKYDTSWRPSSWNDYNEPSEYPNYNDSPQAWIGVRLTEVQDPVTSQSQQSSATESTVLSEKATASYLTDYIMTEQEPPYTSQCVVPPGNQHAFPTQRETTSNETVPSGKDSHYADLQLGNKSNRKTQATRTDNKVVYSKVKAAPSSLSSSEMRRKNLQAKNVPPHLRPQPLPPGYTRPDQGYSSNQHTMSSSETQTPTGDYGPGSVYLSTSQQAQNNNDNSFSLVTSPASHADQLQQPMVSSTNTHSNYDRTTGSATMC